MRHPHWLFSGNLSFKVFAMHHWHQDQTKTQEKNCWIKKPTNWQKKIYNKDNLSPTHTHRLKNVSYLSCVAFEGLEGIVYLKDLPMIPRNYNSYYKWASNKHWWQMTYRNGILRFVLNHDLNSGFNSNRIRIAKIL